MEDIYITGANGFLGKHLAARLGGHTPIPHQEIPTSRIQTFDKFFFLSTYGNLYHHQGDDRIVQANVLDLAHILDQIDFQKGFKSFIYISSSSVKLERQTMYSRTKRMAEELLLAYADKYNAPICAVRPFSITGVGEQKEHLIPTLIRSCLFDEPMNFVPRPIHDWIDVDDVTDALILLSQKGAKGIFEIGTGEGVSNIEVLRLVEKVTGKKANINTVYSLREYDNNSWVSGNFNVRRYGWKPKKSLEQTITEMVEEAKNGTK